MRDGALYDESASEAAAHKVRRVSAEVARERNAEIFIILAEPVFQHTAHPDAPHHDDGIPGKLFRSDRGAARNRELRRNQLLLLL